MRISVLFIGILMLPIMGCAGYMKDRLKDSAEMFEAGIGFSSGLDVNLRATKLMQIGLGSYTGDWIGLREGRFASWKEERSEMGVSPFYYHEVYRASDTLLDIHPPLFTEPGYQLYPNDYSLISDRGFFEFGLTANLVLIGIDVVVEGAEVVDFITGWFGMDLLRDDGYSRTLEDLVCQTQSLNPYYRAAAIRALRLRTGLDFGYVMVTPRNEHTDEQIRAWVNWKNWLAQCEEASLF